MKSPDALFFGMWREFLNPWPAIRGHFRLTELVIKDAADDEWRVLQAATSDMDEETRGEYLADHAAAHELLKLEIPQFHRRGAFVTVISEWEKEYREVAIHILRVENQRHGSSLQFDDFRGSVYEQSRKVVTRLARVDDDTEAWEILREGVLVRHVLVHLAGRVKMHEGKVADPKLAHALERLKPQGLSWDDNGLLVLEAPCLEYLVSTVERYMQSIVEACQKKYERPLSRV